MIQETHGAGKKSKAETSFLNSVAWRPYCVREYVPETRKEGGRRVKKTSGSRYDHYR